MAGLEDSTRPTEMAPCEMFSSPSSRLPLMERNAPTLKCCLDWNMFVDLNLGKLSEIELDAIGRHISSCPKCESNLLDWRNKPIEDNLTHKIKRCLSVPALPDERAFRTMETAAIAIGAPNGVTPFH